MDSAKTWNPSAGILFLYISLKRKSCWSALKKRSRSKSTAFVKPSEAKSLWGKPQKEKSKKSEIWQESLPSGLDNPRQICSRSVVSVFESWANGVTPVKSRMMKRSNVFGEELQNELREVELFSSRLQLPLLLKQLEIDLKDCFQQTHVGSIVKSHHIFPHIHNNDFSSREGKQSWFTFKVLVKRRVVWRGWGWVRREPRDFTWFSPRSLPSVPSTSMTSKLPPAALLSQSP